MAVCACALLVAEGCKQFLEATAAVATCAILVIGMVYLQRFLCYDVQVCDDNFLQMDIIITS